MMLVIQTPLFYEVTLGVVPFLRPPLKDEDLGRHGPVIRPLHTSLRSTRAP